jgi:hypothetical protein
MDEEKLIPSIPEWKKVNGDDFSIIDWITAEGNAELAVGYLKLFFPDYIEYKGGIFLSTHFSEDSYNKWEGATESKKDLESSMNHVHILDFFGTNEAKDKVTREQLSFIGNQLKQIWELKLHRDFPSKVFKVDFYIPSDGDLIEYQLTFYQVAWVNE